MISKQNGNIFYVFSWPLPVGMEEDHKQTIFLHQYLKPDFPNEDKIAFDSIDKLCAVSDFKIFRVTVLSKMLGQNSRMSFSHQNKKVYINIRPEKNAFWFYLQTAFNCTQSMSYFTNTCHNTFTVHVPILITVEFLLFIKTQYTINVQNIVRLICYTYVKSLARPTSRCHRTESIISWNEGSVHVLNCKYFLVTKAERKHVRRRVSLVAVACSLPGRAKDLSPPL
jgi:hypothetical protein